MNNVTFVNVEKHLKALKNRTRWKKAFTVFASLVVVATVSALTLPAISDSSKTFCGMEEHQHDDSCYEVVFICSHEQDSISTTDVIDSSQEGETTTSSDSVEPSDTTQAEESFDEGDSVQSEETTSSQSEKTEETTCESTTSSDLVEPSDTTQEEEASDEGDSPQSEETTSSQSEKTEETTSESTTSSDSVEPSDSVQAEETTSSQSEKAEEATSESTTSSDSVESSDFIEAEEATVESTTFKVAETTVSTNTAVSGAVSVSPLSLALATQEVKAEQITADGTDNIVLFLSSLPDESDSDSQLTSVQETTAEETTTSTQELTEQTTQSAHVHTEECYQKVLICEIEEHTHSTACMSDPEADVETQEDWDKMFSNFESTGIRSIDLITVAETQLDYSESLNNYIVDEDGVSLHGYTRYGAWFGDPYGEWGQPFVLFCMEYAGIDIIPKDNDCETWISIFKDESNGLYREINGYIPIAGDLVFLDLDEDGVADKVAIASETSSDDTMLTVIEGDTNDRVGYVTYEMNDPRIIGFVQFSLDDAHETANYSIVNVSGTHMYHAPDYIEYQYSSHKVNNFMTLTYVLIPYNEYILGNWTPNVIDWSATAKANYVVAYCADRNTDISETGESYVTQTIYESSYEDCADVLAGIVGNCYPFITASEMRAKLEEAYIAGEITTDLSCCTESEYIAAAQWAIWDMTGLSGTQTTASSSTFPSYNQYALNPLTNVGHTNETTIQSHVKAIRDWLVKCRAAAPLAIVSDSSTITQNKDGTYNVETSVTFNRALEERENVIGYLIAGDKYTVIDHTEDGSDTLTFSLSNLTKEELLEARVQFDVEFSHMQVYVYDSGNYQDMISGQWGTDTFSLGFDIEVETTNADVTKVWADASPGTDAITVQLYADGVPCGDSVELSDSNNWTHTWENLIKYSASGVEIDYTIQEELVPGYVSTVEKDTDGVRTIITAETAASFTEGASYVLRSSSNALTDATATGGNGLTWTENTDISIPSSIPDAAIWIASRVSSDGTNAYLKNKATGKYLSYNGTYITLSSSASSKTYFLYNHLYLLSGINNRYLLSLNNGYGYITTDWDSALSVNLNKISETSVATEDISFLITNSKSEENTSVSVRKEWAGRSDGLYPESATVQLLRNGEIYGTAVELNAENGWYYKWEYLPLAYGEQSFVYTVQEVEVNGYTVTTTIQTSEDGTPLYVLTNTWSPEYVSLKLQKSDSENITTLLTGAVFELYRAVVSEGGVEDSVTIPRTTQTQGVLVQTLAPTAEEALVIEELQVGETYYLVETEAPEGYHSLKVPIAFIPQIDEEGNTVLQFISGQEFTLTETDENDELTLTVYNEKGYILPETGGSGIICYYLAGILLILISLTVCLIKKRKEINKKIY